MRLSLVLALSLGLWALALPAGAQVYRWVDPDGSIHYSDNSASAPKNARVEVTTGDDITVEGSGRIEAGTPPSNPPVPAQQPSAPAAGASGEWSKDSTSTDEQTVRQYFRSTHQKIAETQAQLEQQRQTVRNYESGNVPQCNASPQECAEWKLQVRAARDQAAKRVTELEADLRKWTSYLDDLERWASSKAIPRAWRE
jgi:hypothetical protein